MLLSTSVLLSKFRSVWVCCGHVSLNTLGFDTQPLPTVHVECARAPAATIAFQPILLSLARFASRSLHHASLLLCCLNLSCNPCTESSSCGSFSQHPEPLPQGSQCSHRPHTCFQLPRWAFELEVGPHTADGSWGGRPEGPPGASGSPGKPLKGYMYGQLLHEPLYFYFFLIILYSLCTD